MSDLTVKARTHAQDARAARPVPARRWTLVAVALATFMTYLDNNIINVAIPTMQRDLRLTESGIEWVVSAYILVFAGLLLAGGRLADVFGRKRLFSIGLAVFTGASLLAGLAGSADLLTASRALQGLGAALATPTTLALISDTFPEPAEQARAVGIWSAAGALALALGPLLGGLFTVHLSWHWIFFVNVPVGVATLVLGWWAIPASRGRQRRSLDGPGLGASAVTLLALTYALIQGHAEGWTSPLILGSFALAAMGTVVFVLLERWAADPMIALSVFSDRILRGGVVAVMLWAFGLFGIYFFTSLYLQDVLAFSAVKAGMAFVPMALLMAAGAAVSDRVSARVGLNRTVGAAMALMAGGIVSVSFFGAHLTFAGLMPSFAVIGIGGGLTIPLASSILGAMPADRAGIASGVFNASREVAGLLGITVIGVVLTARQAALGRGGATPLQAFLGGYRLGLIVAGVLVAAGGLVAWLSLPRPTSSVAPAAVVRDRDRPAELGAEVA